MSKHDFQKEGIPFTQIANTVINDSRLSAKAKGIYVYLYSKPDGWDFALDRITLAFTDGRKGIYSGMKELEECGYLVRKKQPSGRTTYLLKITSSLLPLKGSRVEEPVAPEGNVPFGHVAQKGSISNKDIKVIKNISNKESTPIKAKDLFNEETQIQPSKGRKSYGIDYLKEIPPEDIKLFSESYSCPPEVVLETAESVILYCESKGRRYKNYRAALQKWLLQRKQRSSVHGQTQMFALQEPETIEI